MKNYKVLSGVLLGLSLFFIAASLLVNNIRSRREVSGSVLSTVVTGYPTVTPPYRTPTPSLCGLAGSTFRESCGADSYRYIDYRCRNGYSASQGSSSSCKNTSTWLTYANNDCNINGCGPTPTPTRITQPNKYLYLTYTCRSDSRGGTYVLNSGNTCKVAADLLREASNACSQRTAGACSGGTGLVSNCLETSSFSPTCAVKLSPSPTVVTRTPTPTCLRYIPSDLNGDGRVDSGDYALWLQRNAGSIVCPVSPTPTRHIYPTTLPYTPYPSSFIQN